MKIKFKVPTTFIVASSLLTILGTYLLATKTSFHPQLFISACGEVLKNIQEHVHFNPDGVISSLILLIASISVSLTFWQLVRFIISHRRLQRLNNSGWTSDKLLWVIRKHNIMENRISVVSSGKLSAYTVGLFKPRIVVSEALVYRLSKKQLEAVVLHELYHLQNRHVSWLLFSRLISSLFFFIPVIEYLAAQLKTEFELSADAFVVERQKTRNHLCGSLALNIQYAGGVIPNFATSPIEKRVESLLGNKLSFEQIGVKPLAVSIFSLGLMIVSVFIQPSQVTADFAFEAGGVCGVDSGCQTTDCTGHETNHLHNFTPVVLASFQSLSSH